MRFACEPGCAPGKVSAASRQGSGASCTTRCIVHQPFPPCPEHAMPNVTTQKPVRLTISVSPEVHAAFERLSAASGQSMSKCMGEWLSDTLEAVEYTATMVEKARQAPKMVMREMHAYAMGLADEVGSVLNTMRKDGTGIAQAYEKVKDGGADAGGGMPKARATGGRADALPPSCNTGGKVPSRGRKIGQKSGGKAA